MSVGYVDNNAFVQSIIDKGRADASNRNTGDLGKQEFLNLLVMQLRYQDPLNPVDDKAFIAQMAQFSALEQMQNMNASNTAMKGFSMIGKYVSAMLNDNATGQPLFVEGHVESVVMSGTQTYVVVGGREVPIDNVYNVADGFNPLNSSLASYTGLIGYMVKGAVYDISTGEIVGVSGEVMSLKKGAYEDYALLNGVNATLVGINQNGSIIEDRNKLKEYLDNALAKEPGERQIEVFITDENGKRVPIAATLRSYTYDPVFGTIKAVLDDVAVPVASVASIQKAVPEANKSGAGGSGDGDNGDNVDNIDGEAGKDGVDNTGGADNIGAGQGDGAEDNGAAENGAAAQNGAEAQDDITDSGAEANTSAEP